jgi:hypothetical protein
MSRRRTAIGVAVVAITGTGGAVVAASQGSAYQRRAPREATLPGALGQSFGVFRGLRPYEAKAIPNRTGLKIWLIPGAEQTCIKFRDSVAGSDGGDCVPNNMVLAGEMSPIIGGSNGVIVVGLAPDRNRTVRLVRASGMSETVQVSNNVYIASTRRGFRTVTVRDSAGALRTWVVPDDG